jgi:hypothetical protein
MKECGYHVLVCRKRLYFLCGMYGVFRLLNLLFLLIQFIMMVDERIVADNNFFSFLQQKFTMSSFLFIFHVWSLYF